MFDGETPVRCTPGVEIARACEVQYERAVLDVDLIDTKVVVGAAAGREVLASRI